MRWLAILVLLPLSGCTDIPEPTEMAQPDRILVRGFVDDLDDDGTAELHIRLAAVTGTLVHSFTGQVEVVLMPQSTGSLAKSWTVEVSDELFHDAILPYYEIVDEGDYGHGESVELRAEAVLADGTWLQGSHRTTF